MCIYMIILVVMDTSMLQNCMLILSMDCVSARTLIDNKQSAQGTKCV